LTVEESSDEETVTQRRRQASKKQKINQSSAKKESYGRILKRHMNQAHKNNAPAAGRKRTNSATDSDECLDTMRELENAQKKATFWKAKCKEQRQDNVFLQEQLKGYQALLSSKIFSFTKLQKQHGNCLVPLKSHLCYTELEIHCGNYKPKASTKLVPSTSSMPPQPSPSVYESLEDFSYTTNGSLHLKKGIIINKVQARKIMMNKKATVVAKDTAQALWTQAGLAERSVKGVLAPNKKKSGEAPKPALTPEKVEVVAATVSHWGKKNEVDVGAVLQNLTPILTEKIQDCIKAERRQL
ncbi:unnamed protein product, partial [Ixodes pacificus]